MAWTFVALLVTSAIAARIVSMSSQSISSGRSNTWLQARENLEKRIRSDLANPHRLWDSMQAGYNQNANLRRCIEGDEQARPSTNPPWDCRGAVPGNDRVYRFILATQRGANTIPLSRPWTRGVVVFGKEFSRGGQGNAPNVSYDRYGLLCQRKDASFNANQCPLEVFTAFRPVCRQNSSNPPGQPPKPGDPRLAQCVSADYIEFFFVIGTSREQYNLGEGVRADLAGFGAPIGPVTNLRNPLWGVASDEERRGSIVIKASDIRDQGAGLCPIGQVVVGFDDWGNRQCGYQRNPCNALNDPNNYMVHVGNDTNGNPICQKPRQWEQCSDPNQVLVGFQAPPSGAPICVFPKISNKQCPVDHIITGFDANGDPQCLRAVNNQNCPQNSFLVGYNASGNAICRYGEITYNFGGNNYWVPIKW